jgi:hypothetical protein
MAPDDESVSGRINGEARALDRPASAFVADQLRRVPSSCSGRPKRRPQ